VTLAGRIALRAAVVHPGLEPVHGIVERLDPAGRALPTTVKLGRPVGGMALEGPNLWLTIR